MLQTKHTRAARVLRAKRETEGVCVLGCGNTPVPGKKRCETCLGAIAAKVSSRQKAHRADAKRLGLCYQCPLSRKNKAIPGKVLCQECATKMRNYRLRIYKSRIKSGLCGKCGIRPRAEHTLCVECSSSEKKRGPFRHVTRSKLLKQNICTNPGCGKSAFKGYLCVECAKEAAMQQQRRRLDRVAAGLCGRCGLVKVKVPGTSCAQCRKKRRVSDPKNPGAIRCSKCGANHRCSSPKCPMRHKRS